MVDCLDNFVSRFALFSSTPAGRFFVHGSIEGDQGQLLTLLQGTSHPLAEIFAGAIQPLAPIPVTADNVLIIAGPMGHEIFHIIGGTPKLLDSFLIVASMLIRETLVRYKWLFIKQRIASVRTL